MTSVDKKNILMNKFTSEVTSHFYCYVLTILFETDAESKSL